MQTASDEEGFGMSQEDHEWRPLLKDWEWCEKCHSIRPLGGQTFANSNCNQLRDMIAAHSFERTGITTQKDEFELVNVRCTNCFRTTQEYYHSSIPFPLYIDAIGNCKKFAMQRALAQHGPYIFISWYRWTMPFKSYKTCKKKV